MIFFTFFTSKLSSIRHKIASNISSLVVPLVRSPVTAPSPLSHLSAVSLAESARLIHELSATKSSPTDVIPVSCLKSCSSIFANLLTDLANRSFDQGTFPTAFKLAQITPLLKKPNLDADDSSSFRPISNLRTIGKLFERLVLTHLRHHLTASPFFSSLQSAYLPSYSTETALIKVTNDLFASTALTLTFPSCP
jgi:hypothetical protein